MADRRNGPRPAGGLTVRALWEWLSAGDVDDWLLDWAPDIGTLTSVLVERSHAFRFVVSPPIGQDWPPPGHEPFDAVVIGAAEQWRKLMDAGAGGAPELVRQLWRDVLRHLDTPIASVVEGDPWELCSAILMLHAIADEAAIGRAAGSMRTGHGEIHRAQARELLVRTGSSSRLPTERVTHLPKIRTTSVGITHRSLSRYSCTTTDSIPVTWHRAPLRKPGADPTSRHANVLLLPWPMRIRETDFVPWPGSVHRPEREPFGFFSYVPSEPVDLDLLDRMLASAMDEVDLVDAVIMPEGRLAESEVDAFEEVLARHHVRILVTGIRPEAPGPDRFPGNALHIGARVDHQWWHYRQNKHHRWFLDAGQIEAYNIAGALHPSVKWWEAMDIPQRSVNFVELGGGITIAAVVCEDLARQDGVAELLRAVGPTLVITLLLDGPQLASRWTSRYAGVLADDPGSAVLTLTAHGMTDRSRPGGRPASPVVAMWKDPVRGIREIALENGAQGALLKAVIGRAPRYAADGRRPTDDATDFYVAGVQPVKAPATGPVRPADPGASDPAARIEIDEMELSILSSWVEGVADAVAGALQESAGDSPPDSCDAAAATVSEVLAVAAPGAPWRREMGLPEPSDRLDEALTALGQLARTSLADAGDLTVDGVLTVLHSAAPELDPIDHLVSTLYRSALDGTRAEV